MSDMKLSYYYELVPETDGERVIVRNWVELDGYVEVVFQKYDNGWEDVECCPAINLTTFIKVSKSLEFAQSQGLI